MKEVIHEYTIAGRPCAICISSDDQFADVRFLMRRAYNAEGLRWIQVSPDYYTFPVEDLPGFIAALQAALTEFTDAPDTAGGETE